MYLPQNEKISSKPRRPSSISMVLKATETSVLKRSFEFDGSDVPNPGLKMVIASDLQTRTKAYKLAWEVYKESGYTSRRDDAQQMIVKPTDADARTITFLLINENDEAVATVSVNPDSCLPSEKLFSRELKVLKNAGRCPAEVTRLAVKKEYAGSKSILSTIFNFLSVYSREVLHATDLVIEVHPRHAGYYKRLLLFKQTGEEKPCERVNGSPAALLVLDLAEQAEEISVVGGSNGKMKGPNGRTLYSRFCSIKNEECIVDFIENNFRSMTRSEIIHFGLESRDIDTVSIPAA